MKTFLKNTFLIFIIFILSHCNVNYDSINNPTPSRKDLLTDGIWEVASDSEMGSEGIKVHYFSDGSGQSLVIDGGISRVFESWDWSLNNDESELTMEFNHNTQIEVFNILELTKTNFSGIVINNSFNIGKTLKLIK
jgi:hypothetical protein